MVLIAGKINHPETISRSLTQKNVAFGPAAQRASAALAKLSKGERARIMSRYNLFDPIVPAADIHVPGACNCVQPTMGHAFTIASQMFFAAAMFIRRLRNQAKN